MNKIIKNYACYKILSLEPRRCRDIKFKKRLFLGRNHCPDTHPYSYNYGTKCCESPLDGSDNTKLLNPTSTSCFGSRKSLKFHQ